MAEIASRPYRPGEGCCEACVFGRGSHSATCELAARPSVHSDDSTYQKLMALGWYSEGFFESLGWFNPDANRELKADAVAPRFSKAEAVARSDPRR